MCEFSSFLIIYCILYKSEGSGVVGDHFRYFEAIINWLWPVWSTEDGRVLPMVVVSILPHAEFWSNDHLGDARHFFSPFPNFWMSQSLAYHCSSNSFLVKYEVIKFRKQNLPLDGKSFLFINSSRLFTSYSDVKFWNHSVFAFCTCFNNVSTVSAVKISCFWILTGSWTS